MIRQHLENTNRNAILEATIHFLMDFPGSSAAKESTCNTGDPGSIPGLGRSTGEGIGYSLQYSWASLVTQTVKNPPAMCGTSVRSLCWEDPLLEGMTTRSSILVHVCAVFTFQFFFPHIFVFSYNLKKFFLNLSHPCRRLQLRHFFFSHLFANSL